MATFVINPFLMRRRLLSGIDKCFVGVLQCNKKLSAANMKPPNILVYYPKDTRPCLKECVNSAIEKCLTAGRYVVYTLPYNKAMKDPWMDNCQLLIVPSVCGNEEGFADDESNILEKYLSRQGKILNFCISEMPSFGLKTVEIVCPIEKFKSTDTGTVVHCADDWQSGAHRLDVDFINDDKFDSVLSAVTSNDDVNTVAVKNTTKDGGQIIHCSLPLLQTCTSDSCKRPIFDVTGTLLRELLRTMGLPVRTADPCASTCDRSMSSSGKSCCYLLSVDQRLIDGFLLKLGASSSNTYNIRGSPTSLKLRRCEDFSNVADILSEEDALFVPVFYSLKKVYPSPIKFDWDEYQRHLTSTNFGKLVLYSDLVTSTMDIAEPLAGRLLMEKNINITCIAHQQSKGKGRGGNKWLSPPGTAMFTSVFSIPLRSPLGKNLSIIQHLMTVAVVHSVRSLPGLQQLDLRVKWPNDIYIGSSVKIGGVLVKSTIFQDLYTVTIGCGVNVSNEYPTKCINDAITSGGFTVDQLTCEKVLALSISCLERLIASYQENGPGEFFDLYYKYWIHSCQNVQVRFQKDKLSTHELVNATVSGIDASGFLRVVTFKKTDGSFEEISLQPDSNSFDMTKNLIAMKG